eukprot:Clim_evm51s142 gene=Clim_evmTU51s142
MEFLVGVTGKGFTLLAADKMSARSIVMMKDDEEKIKDVSGHLAMAVVGEPGDNVIFPEYIAKNVRLYELRNGITLSTHAAANFIRSELSRYLRSRTPYQVNLLLGGVDGDESALYFMDYLGAMQKVPFGAHGYGAFFTMSTMDRYYKPDMSKEEAFDLMKKVLAELNKRFLINMTKFSFALITSEGIVRMDSLDEAMAA